MTKVVLTIQQQPRYNDVPERRYHFPKRYLDAAASAVGDRILYYEPRRAFPGDTRGAGRKAYIATARVSDVIPDPDDRQHHYALIEDYIRFPRPVPLAEAGHVYEAALRAPNGNVSGPALRGTSIRPIPDDEFDLIVAAGTSPVIEELRREASEHRTGFSEPVTEFERPIIQQLINKKLRDALFARVVRDAYDSTCAVTGLRIINGGGRAEIEAAHIRPVEKNGPDWPRNGIALCRTAHWMFDRGLICLTTDGRFKVNQDSVPEPARRILRADGKLILPKDQSLRPYHEFVEWHRRELYEPKLQRAGKDQ